MINLQAAIESSPKKLKIVKGDVRNPRSLSNALREVDMIYHLAVACQWATLENPVLAHSVNAEGTPDLCRAIGDFLFMFYRLRSTGTGLGLQSMGATRYDPRRRMQPTKSQLRAA
jgi:GDP-D-mannose dehydratase